MPIGQEEEQESIYRGFVDELSQDSGTVYPGWTGIHGTDSQEAMQRCSTLFWSGLMAVKSIAPTNELVPY